VVGRALARVGRLVPFAALFVSTVPEKKKPAKKP